MSPWSTLDIAAGFFRAARGHTSKSVLYPDRVVRGWQVNEVDFDSKLSRLEGLAQQARFLPSSWIEIADATLWAAHSLNHVLLSHIPAVVAVISDMEARWRWKDAGLRRKPRGDEWLAFQALLDAGEVMAAYRLIK